MAKTVTSYIKVTNHFLKKLSELGEIPEDVILCTVDVVGLYPNIPHEEGLEALRRALDGRENKSVSTESLTELAQVVLKNNCFEFNGEFYQQLQGTAIGTKFAPSYAILFMAALEERLLSDATYKPWLWWRFIDDIFLISLQPSKKGIPCSQALRIRRICSEDRFFDRRVGELKGWLVNRGYREGETDQQIERVRSCDRVGLLNRQNRDQSDGRIPLVLTYHPALNKDVV